jgi:hypothetical protein
MKLSEKIKRAIDHVYTVTRELKEEWHGDALELEGKLFKARTNEARLDNERVLDMRKSQPPAAIAGVVEEMEERAEDDDLDGQLTDWIAQLRAAMDRPLAHDGVAGVVEEVAAWLDKQGNAWINSNTHPDLPPFGPSSLIVKARMLRTAMEQGEPNPCISCDDGEDGEPACGIDGGCDEKRKPAPKPADTLQRACQSASRELDAYAEKAQDQATETARHVGAIMGREPAGGELRCLWCGGDMEVEEERAANRAGEPRWYWISCTECGARGPIWPECRTEKEAKARYARLRPRRSDASLVCPCATCNRNPTTDEACNSCDVACAWQSQPDTSLAAHGYGAEEADKLAGSGAGEGCQLGEDGCGAWKKLKAGYDALKDTSAAPEPTEWTCDCCHQPQRATYHKYCTGCAVGMPDRDATPELHPTECEVCGEPALYCSERCASDATPRKGEPHPDAERLADRTRAWLSVFMSAVGGACGSDQLAHLIKVTEETTGQGNPCMEHWPDWDECLQPEPAKVPGTVWAHGDFGCCPPPRLYSSQSELEGDLGQTTGQIEAGLRPGTHVQRVPVHNAAEGECEGCDSLQLTADREAALAELEESKLDLVALHGELKKERDDHEVTQKAREKVAWKLAVAKIRIAELERRLALCRQSAMSVDGDCYYCEESMQAMRDRVAEIEHHLNPGPPEPPLPKTLPPHPGPKNSPDSP